MAVKLIDNERLSLASVINDVAPSFKKLSIATGYWDLPGFLVVRQALEKYDSIRILIGQEPLPPAYVKNLDLENLDETFPEVQLKESLANLGHSSDLRSAAKMLRDWIAKGRVEVKIFRGGFLHAKAYIFGDSDSSAAVGIIGSSNFTAAGLERNLELNAFEDDPHKVLFNPNNENQPHGHLSWFDSMWNHPKSENWDGKFTEIIDASPLGDLVFSQYHMYVKALYEIYGDELTLGTSDGTDLEQILYDFQVRNAKLLLKKLERHGIAMLADSVGLGKTITAGAVIKTYLDEYDATRVYIVAPASLTSQWTTELAEAFRLVSGFEVISMQDVNKIRQAREIDKYAPVDLFVIDEAHNLRSGTGSRYNEFLDWFTDNPDSHVLLLTATPINNSLIDLKNQIQLAAKGQLQSFPVVYPTQDKVDVLDFYDAIDRLNAEIKRSLKAGKTPDYQKVSQVMKQGLRHFMVRTTRRGIEQEFGGVKTHDGTLLKFPKSKVVPTGYSFNPNNATVLNELMNSELDTFEGHNVSKLNVNWLLDVTQRAEHPLDTIKNSPGAFGVSEAATPFESIFQALLLLGFAPYKPEVYKKKYLKKDLAAIRASAGTPEEKFKLASQLSIHNILRVTLLKRLESSQHALSLSLQNYKKRIEQFSQLLNQGKISRIKDLDSVLELFADSTDDLESDAINLDAYELVDADPAIFDVQALKQDLQRDTKIIDVMLAMCKQLETSDDKLVAFANLITDISNQNPLGTKVLVFSYFADTIDYLRQKLPGLVRIGNFSSVAEFTSGKTKSQINELAKRFSPKSKKASSELMAQGELQYLFATDVLSEGQNLQDCGVLVNFDLHWNPVRMIQRNGRINRLGSSFDQVFIYNMHPDQNLNIYLTLVERLQAKIEQIRHAIGTDQSILGEEENPLEFIDLYDPTKANDALGDLDDDGDLLSEDEFVKDLREFDSSASAAEKAAVSQISNGKWGHLPDHSVAFVGEIDSLSLVRVSGHIAQTGQAFKSHLFIKNKDGFGPVETFKALSALRVGKTVNQRAIDRIQINRDEVEKRTLQLAKVHAGKLPQYFRYTKTVHLALDALATGNPEINLDSALKKIRTKQTKKRADKLIRQINADLRNQGGISEGSVESCRTFIELMAQFEHPEAVLTGNSLLGVLHFGQ